MTIEGIIEAKEALIKMMGLCPSTVMTLKDLQALAAGPLDDLIAYEKKCEALVEKQEKEQEKKPKGFKETWEYLSKNLTNGHMLEAAQVARFWTMVPLARYYELEQPQQRIRDMNLADSPYPVTVKVLLRKFFRRCFDGDRRYPWLMFQDEHGGNWIFEVLYDEDSSDEVPFTLNLEYSDLFNVRDVWNLKEYEPKTWGIMLQPRGQNFTHFKIFPKGDSLREELYKECLLYGAEDAIDTWQKKETISKEVLKDLDLDHYISGDGVVDTFVCAQWYVTSVEDRVFKPGMIMMIDMDAPEGGRQERMVEAKEYVHGVGCHYRGLLPFPQSEPSFYFKEGSGEEESAVVAES